MDSSARAGRHPLPSNNGRGCLEVHFHYTKSLSFLDFLAIVPELTWPMYQGQSASEAAIFGRPIPCDLDFDFEPSTLWHPSHYLMGEDGRGCWKFHFNRHHEHSCTRACSALNDGFRNLAQGWIVRGCLTVPAFLDPVGFNRATLALSPWLQKLSLRAQPRNPESASHTDPLPRTQVSSARTEPALRSRRWWFWRGAQQTSPRCMPAAIPVRPE
jgi:hypothetical protein